MSKNKTLSAAKSEKNGEQYTHLAGDRSEVVSAQIGTNLFAHVYDYIGNCEEEFKERK